MKSVILRTPSRLILQIMILFSIFMLMRGHNAPGGGFIGGLIAACALSLYHISQGNEYLEDLQLFDYWPHILGIGVLCLFLSSTFSVLLHKSFLTTQLWSITLFQHKIKIGSFFIFDLGVYLLVIGAVAIMIEALERHL